MIALKKAKELKKKGKFGIAINDWLTSFNARQNPSELDVGNEEQEFSLIITFEKAPNNFEFDFEQLFFNPFRFSDVKIFQVIEIHI